MADSKIIIKKYSNRRLYNMEESKYITLEDVKQMVKDGIEFEVRDAKTGEDLTRQTFAQIILEQEVSGFNLLPLSFLRQLIGFYDDSISHLVPHYLESSMQQFTSQQENMRKTLERSWQGLGVPLQAFEEATRRNIEMFQQTLEMFDALKPHSPERKSDAGKSRNSQ